MDTTGKFSLRVILLVMLLGLFGQAAHAAVVCDVNNDGVINLTDINLIIAARNKPATGPNDPRDADHDGTITVLDARICVTRCTLPGCAVSGNSPPTANAGPDQTVALGATVTLNGSGSSDPDGNSLVYSWSFVSTPAGSSTSLQNPTSINPRFVVDVAGPYVVRLIVNDGTVDSAPDDVQISTINSRPIANAGPHQTVFVETTVTLDGSGSSDPDGDPLTFTWSLDSLPLESTTTLQNIHSVNPTFVADTPGTYIAQLIVNDGKVDSAPATVTIDTQNSAPVANAGPNQTVAVGATVQLNGANSTDVDGDPLTYKWSLTTKPTGSTAALSATSIVNPTFVADTPGTYIAQLIVNDGKVDSAPATVTTTTLNTPPVANAGPNQTVAVGATVQLNGANSTDVDGDPLTYKWSLTTKPTGSTAALSATSIVNPTFVADTPGTYIAQLIVNDGKVDSAPATVTTTTLNTPPVANAGPNQTVFTGNIVQLNASASADADGNPLTYQWSFASAPTGSTAILSNPTTISPTFTADVFGTYVVQLIVNDGFVNSAPVTVTISTQNSAPVANAGPNQTVAAGGTVQLDGSASSDVDGNALRFRWSLLSTPAGSSATLSATNLVNPTFVTDLTGTYVAQLIVNDGFVESIPATVTVTVTAGTPPLAATLVSPNGTVSTATPTYTWNAVSGATWYELWVTDSAQAGKVKQWVTAAQAGCAAGTGACSYTPSTALATGAATWWIQTWNSLGYGPWSTGMAFTVTAGTPPLAATLVSPNGAVSTATPTYTWNAVSGATWYELWVTDSAQAGKVKQWVTAAQAGCAAGTGACSYTPSTALATGAATWWIQTWNSLGYGPWSTGMAFTVTAGAPVITLVNPNTGPQGATNLNVAVTGQNTNWVQNTTTASVGAGITVNSVTVASVTSLTANLTIAADAATGARSLTVTTNAEIVTLANAFTVTAGPSDLTITKTHTGTFSQGQDGATYSITVSNIGPGPTAGTVTVTETVPTGLTATGIAGTGWTCAQPAGPCTRSDLLASGGNYPPINLTVNVANSAPASVTNTATVAGGGELNTANNAASDVTTIGSGPDLTIAKTHTGNFTQGQTGATYAITVRNVGAGPTAGTVTVTDTLPTGLTATAFGAGPTDGWNCTLTPLSCERSGALAAGQSYPAITLTVTVASNAPANETNTATVAGGGDVNPNNNTATDPTTILPAANLAPTLDLIADRSILEDAGPQTVNLTGISAGPNETQVLTVSATSNNLALIPNPTVTYTSPNATGSLAFTPVANASGAATITVTVQDNGGTANGGVDTFVRTFTVTVTAVNDAPTLDAIGNLSIAENAGPQTVNLTGIRAGPRETQS